MKTKKAATTVKKKKPSVQPPAPAQGAARKTPELPTNGTPATIELRAQLKGEVFIKLRILDATYTAEKIAKLLNAGNALWDVGDAARYHRIEHRGKLIAEIQYADEDMHWERYEAV